MDDTRTHAERRQDALDWARNEASAMDGAHQSGEGLSLSPGSCESISNFLRLVVEVIEADSPALRQEAPVGDLERLLSNAVNDALTWDHGHVPHEKFRVQLSTMVVQALETEGYRITPTGPDSPVDPVDPEVDAIRRCVVILKPLATTSAASDVATYLAARFHARMP